MNIDQLAAKYREARVAGDKESWDAISEQVMSSQLSSGGTVMSYLFRREQQAARDGQELSVSAILFKALETPTESSFIGKLKKAIDFAAKGYTQNKLLVFRKKIFDPNGVPRHIYDMPASNDEEVAAKMLEAYKWEEWGIGREYERVMSDPTTSKDPAAAMAAAKGRIKRAADWWDDTYAKLSGTLKGAMSRLAQDPSADPVKIQEINDSLTPGIYEEPLPDVRISSQHPYKKPDPEVPQTWVASRPEFKGMSRRFSAMMDVFRATIGMANDESSPLQGIASKAVNELGLESGLDSAGENFLTAQMLNPERWGLGQAQLMTAVTSKGTVSYDAMLSKPKDSKKDDEEEGPSMEGGAGGSSDEDVRKKTDRPQTIEEMGPLAGDARDVANEQEEKRTILLEKDPMDLMRNSLDPVYHRNIMKYIISPGSQAAVSKPMDDRTKISLSRLEKALQGRGLSGNDLASEMIKRHLGDLSIAERGFLVKERGMSREEAAQEVAQRQPQLNDRAAKEVREYLNPPGAAGPMVPGTARDMSENKKGLLDQLTPEDKKKIFKTRNRFEQVRPTWSSKKDRQTRMDVSKAMLQWMADNAFKPGSVEQALASALPSLHFQIPANKKLHKDIEPNIGQPGQKELYERFDESLKSNKERQHDNLRRLNEIMRAHGVPNKAMPEMLNNVVGVIMQALSNDSMYQRMLADVNSKVPGANLKAIASLMAELRIIRLAIVGGMSRMTRHG